MAGLLGRFHGLIAVAPLKRAAAPRLAATEVKIPRLNRRGPIEAGKPPAEGLADAGIPRLNRRGPIEATVLSCVHPIPIRFHGLIAVAPLKPSRRHQAIGWDDDSTA